jgi:hypothetical protein
MSDAIRRVYNRIDQWLDRRALRAESRATRALGGDAEPRSAAAVLSAVRRVATELDAGAMLKMIVAPEGTNRSGEASRWEFFFDLPARVAKLECVWVLPWDERRDGYAEPTLELRATPFPPPGSPLRRLVDDGKLLYAQLRGQWRAEVARAPALPASIRDSRVALAEAISAGLAVDDEEFSVATGKGADGQPAWIVAGRARRYFSRLAD